MTCCLCLATIPFCDALFSDTTNHPHPPQDRYLLVEEKLDDGDGGGGGGDDDDGVVASGPNHFGGDHDSDDVSSAAFSWTRKASSLATLSLVGLADADADAQDEKVDFDAGFPERFYPRGGGEAAVMATLSNQSLDWSLLTSLNDKIIVDEDDPYLVYEMDFTSEKVGGPTPPPPPMPPPMPYPPSPSSALPMSSPESSPRTVRMIPLESGPYDVDTATKVRTPTRTSTRRTSTASASASASVAAASHHRRDRDVQVAIKSASAAESVDLVFVIDATGSMLKHIQNVKRSIRSIITKCRRTHSSLRLRLAAVAYRDLSDAVHYEVLDFCSSVERFEQFLGSLRCFGGADIPEDLATGIRQANRLGWAHPTRLVFIVADAPCHGIEFHDFDDDYPMGTPGVRIVNELRQLLASVGHGGGSSDREGGGGGSMSLYFGRISSATDEMLDRWNSHYGIRVNVVPFTDAAKVTSAVTKAIRSAIFSTMTVTRRLQQQHNQQQLLADTYRGADGGSQTQQPPVARPKNFPIIPREPTPEEWKKRPVQAVNVFRNQPIRSIEDLYAPLRVSMLKIKAPPSSSSRLTSSILSFAKSSSSSSPSEAHMQMRRAALPFAEGEVRVAFHGHLARTVQDLHDYDAWFASPSASLSTKPPADGRFASMATVLKTLKHHGPGLNGRQQYLMQMEMSTIAGYLAELYNRTCRRHDLAPVHVLNVLVVEEVSGQNERSGNRRFCAESPLPRAAPFTKYSSNAGYWNASRHDETLLRFTEFTYEATSRYLLVTDLQGVKGRDGHYYLTDPVILCQDLSRFGSTNLGGHFMEKCLASTRSLLEERGRYLV